MQPATSDSYSDPETTAVWLTCSESAPQRRGWRKSAAAGIGQGVVCKQRLPSPASQPQATSAGQPATLLAPSHLTVGALVHGPSNPLRQRRWCWHSELRRTWPSNFARLRHRGSGGRAAHLRSVWQRPRVWAPLRATISWSLKPILHTTRIQTCILPSPVLPSAAVL